MPDNLHEPVQQDAILLAKGSDSPAALMKFLCGERAKSLIRSYGYAL